MIRWDGRTLRTMRISVPCLDSSREPNKVGFAESSSETLCYSNHEMTMENVQICVSLIGKTLWHHPVDLSSQKHSLCITIVIVISATVIINQLFMKTFNVWEPNEKCMTTERTILTACRR
jgi:hypothetical protein